MDGPTPSDPGAVLDAAEAEAQALNKRVLAVRLVRGWSPGPVTEETIMSRPGLRALMVVRRQIDCYVSLCKAVEIGKWRDIDTTGVRVDLDPDQFAQWLDDEARWYGRWQDWLARRALPCPVLRYETDIDQPPEAVLRRFAAGAAQLGISLELPSALAASGLVRQDRNRLMAEKVRNWPEFSREIFRRGLETRAFSYPV